MLASAADIETGSALEADLVIVGAGAAGITIATRLIGRPLNVVVLESGGVDFEQEVQDLYRGTVIGLPTEDPDVSRLRYFGGTTNHWAGWCRPLEPEDFEPRADWPEAGWPIRRSDLDPYYPVAADVCELGPVEFEDPDFWRRQPGGERLQPLDLTGGGLRTALFQVSPPTRFAETYGPELEAAANVTVILHAHAVDLLPAAGTDPGAERKAIAGIAAVGPAGTAFTVRGRAVVLAVGGIETPRLLLSSQRIHPEGAGNEHDQVGRYFMDHPWLRGQAYWRFSSEGSDWPLYFQQTAVAGASVFAALAGDPDGDRAAGTGGFRLVLEGSRTSTAGNDSLRAIAGALKQGDMPDDLGDHVAAIMSDLDVIADSAYKTVTGARSSPFLEPAGPDSPLKGAIVDLNFEQRPNPNSRVTLDDDRDALGMRRVRLDWRLDDSDHRTAVRALDLLARAIGQRALGRVRVRPDLEQAGAWPDTLMGSRHHMGTARMSASPKTGVVDSTCRVHSTTNLYIAGSAVFTTCGYANPTLTIVALALRLADHLQAQLT